MGYATETFNRIVLTKILQLYILYIYVLGIMTKHGEGDGADPHLSGEIGQTIDLVGGTAEGGGILLIALDVTIKNAGNVTFLRSNGV